MTAQTVRLVLPYPVSANRYWRSFTHPHAGHTITTLSGEAKAYKKTVARLVHEAGITAPILGPVEVAIELYPHRPLDWAKRAKRDPVWWDLTVQCLDLDNARKVLNDALKNLVFEDDKLIRRDPGEIMIPDGGEARVVVTVKPYVREHQQLFVTETPPPPRREPTLAELRGEPF